MDVESGRILYSNNIHEQKLIASITKIMTCVVAIENSNIEEVVTVPEEVLQMYGTNTYIEASEKLKIKDLLYGLMLRSGNDAALALSIVVAGSEENFVKLMNQKKEELGMKDTIFNNPHGLDEDTKNYSTAHDMAILSKYAYKNNIYKEIIKTKKYSFKSSNKSYIWYNRMKLLTNYKYCIGGKNGYTPKAGKTLVSLANKNDMTLTIVSLNDTDIYNNHKKLYEKYFGKYKKYVVVDKNNFIIDSKNNKKYYIKKSFIYPLTEEEKEKIQTVVEIRSKSKDNKSGKISILLDEKEIGNIDIYEQIKKEEKKSFFKKLKQLFIR